MGVCKDPPCPRTSFSPPRLAIVSSIGISTEVLAELRAVSRPIRRSRSVCAPSEDAVAMPNLRRAGIGMVARRGETVVLMGGG
jgi:hypothetical protein